MEMIGEKIREAVLRRFSEYGVNALKIDVTLAPEGQGADYASNVAMKLTGMLKAKGVLNSEGKSYNPREVAEEIKKEIEKTEFPFEIEIAGPGFLNFISRDEYWKQILTDMQGDFAGYISQDEYYGKMVVCEFSDPNPFKVLHVGHLYTSIMGDSISRLVEFSGGKVARANFGGDVGLHVAKTLYAVIRDGKNTDDIETIAECYVEGTRVYEGDGVSEENSAKEEIVELNKLIYKIAAAGADYDWETGGAPGESEETSGNVVDGDDSELNGKTNKTRNEVQVAQRTISMRELAELYFRGREVSYAYFEDFYAKLNVKFDKYYPESSVARRGLGEVKAHVGEVYTESEGAVVFQGEKYDLHTRVFINKEGLPTYEAKDIGLLFTKWDDYQFDKSIVITGNDIIDYMKVVLKSVSLYAPELVERTKHITHGNVRLPGNEKMSSRKGNFIKAVDVIEGVERALAKDGIEGENGNENGGENKSDDEGGKDSRRVIENRRAKRSSVKADQQITLGAIKYAFLKYKIGGNIEFDIKESVSTTGNSGVYLQYSAVRAKKILRQAETETAMERASSEWVLEAHEKSLIRKLAQYREVLGEAVADLAPHKIANYLYETAQEFSRFYENVKVVGSAQEAERLKIVATYLEVMKSGLGLLGIEVPEEM